MLPVFLREQRTHVRGDCLPVDAESRVIPHKAALAVRVIKIGAFIRENSLVRKHEKSVRKALGNIKHILALTVKNHAEISAERSGAIAQIHGDIINRAREHSHKFSLRMPRLKMKPAEHSF